MNLQQTLERYRDRVEQALDRELPPARTSPAKLHEAMRYATLNGGKRVRACLVYATAETLGVTGPEVDAAACAVELIHAYSLVHDDLPCMDDDDLRRGQPTCHRAFDEATALLAGDALQARAFQILAATPLDSDRVLAMIQCLSKASSSVGMAGGQAIDLAAVGKTLTLEELETMHRLKTGALITASVELGAMATGKTDAATLDHLHDFSQAIGLAFQVVDDILDVEGDTETLGKQAGADQVLNKPTYPSILGLEGAHAHAQALHQSALESLRYLGDNRAILAGIADYIVQRRQ
ncbi:MAG: polyprenyl synthetase family protein [Gammaproteobacteria bacterium]|nr:MAG: polyprenyl synthetase family protein [Gammaproteobacteria bacterium]